MDEKNPLSNFTERNQFFMFQNDFRDSFQTIFSQDVDKTVEGGLFGRTINLQLLSTSFQAAGCCHTGHTGECSFGGPCTTSAGDLMALGKFVESVPRIG